MEFYQYFIGVLSLIISALILGYCNHTRKNEGPLYSSVYLKLSDEEKEKFDIKKEYRRVTVIYGLIGLFFLFVALCVMTLYIPFAYIGLVLLVVDLIYMAIGIIKNTANTK